MSPFSFSTFTLPSPQHRFSTSLRWVAAILLALLPIAVAFDYGGILRWTQYYASLVILAIGVVALLTLFGSPNQSTMRQQRLLIPLFLWLGFSLLQTIPLPVGTVAWLSPASAKAYNEWLAPYLTESESASRVPVSLAREHSRHGTAILAILLVASWASAYLFALRSSLISLLILVSAGASLLAGFGAWRLAYPASDVLTRSFATFVNRNNAALMLNLGLGSSLGLIVWRMNALGHRGRHGSSFKKSMLPDLCRDRDAVIGVITLICCTVGLLICGSRGGLLAAFFGVLLSLLCVRTRGGYQGTPIIILALVSTVVLALLLFKFELTTIDRLESTAHSESGLLNQGRLPHWRDGWKAAVEHFPAGSGLGTYAYAYLPFQEFSGASHFHHADNLWLELFTEQGLFGVLFALSIFAIGVHSIRRLGASPDPLDQGLRTSAAFILIALLVSQTFDFGLILFSNLLIVTIILSALVARAAAVPTPTSNGESIGRKFSLRDAPSGEPAGTGRRRWSTAFAIGPVAVLFGFLAIPTLCRSARAESLSMRVEANLEGLIYDADTLAALLQSIESFKDHRSCPSVMLVQSDLRYRKARLAEAKSHDPPTRELLEQKYRELGTAEKRSQWLQSPDAERFSTRDSTEDAFDADYAEAYSSARQALILTPLSREARTRILYLDFVPQDRGLTKSNLTQLAKLYRTLPPALVKIGRFAADSGYRQIATAAWKRGLSLDPRQTPALMGQINGWQGYDALEVLPESSEVYQYAARYTLATSSPRTDLLRRAQDVISCAPQTTRANQSQCEELLGDIAYALGQPNAAFEHYHRSIKHSPSRAGVRAKLINRLSECGLHVEAFKAAEEAARMFPNDARFQQLTQTMPSELER